MVTSEAAGGGASTAARTGVTRRCATGAEACLRSRPALQMRPATLERSPCWTGRLDIIK